LKTYVKVNRGVEERESRDLHSGVTKMYTFDPARRELLLLYLDAMLRDVIHGKFKVVFGLDMVQHIKKTYYCNFCDRYSSSIPYPQPNMPKCPVFFVVVFAPTNREKIDSSYKPSSSTN